MATAIFTVPAGQSGVFPAPALASVCVQPTAGGSVTLGYGPDGISPTFQSAPQSGNTSPFSLNTSTYSGYTSNFSPNPMGNLGKIQVTAATQLCTVLISDLQQYPGSFPERQTVLQSGVPYALPNSTSELELISIRFHPGYFKQNMRLEYHAQLSFTNNANVKTLKGYFGASTNSATAGAIETAATLSTTNAYTSMAGAYHSSSYMSKNDNATVVAANTGLLSAGGMGSSVTANVSTSVVYSGPSAVETVFILTGTKATGTDTFQLDGIVVKVYQ